MSLETLENRAKALYEPSANGAGLEAEARSAFGADPLLIFRVASAIGQNRGQMPRDEVTAAAKSIVGDLAKVDPVRVREELGASLVHRDVDASLQWLHEVGVFRLLLPEVEATVDLKQEGGRAHKDVWEHTKLVVKQAVPRLAVRWAALLHDIGKVPTRRFTDKGVHFHGHAEVGARMYDKIVRRMPFEKPMRRKIRFLIKHHLRSAQYEPEWTDSAIRRFDREMQEHLVDLLDLSRADITSKRPGRRQFLLKQINELRGRIDALREEDAKVPPLPKGLGSKIMERFGIPPSKQLGNIMADLKAAIERGDVEPHRDFDYYLDHLAPSLGKDSADDSDAE